MVAGVEHDVLNRGPFFVGKFIDGRDVLDTGIVDQNINGTEGGFGGGDEGGDFRGLADVCRVMQNLHPGFRGEIAAQFLNHGGFAKTVEHDVGAGPGHGLSDAEADATGRTGYDDGFIFQHGGSPEFSTKR